jgi:hypothetical protein
MPLRNRFGEGHMPKRRAARLPPQRDLLLGSFRLGVVVRQEFDLRRTCTTGMARLGIAPHVADRVLNHTSGTISGVAAVYNRFAYLPERKAALDAWSRFIEDLIKPPRIILRRPGSDDLPLAAE